MRHLRFGFFHVAVEASVLFLLALSGYWLLVPGPSALAGELDVSMGPTSADEIPSKTLVATPEVLEAGKAIYIRRCLPCHGKNGAGDGPAAEVMNPRPRDFTRGLFKIRSTAHKEVPTDEDLYRTISRGIPGSGMPAWKRLLSEDERLQVISYIKTFSDKFEAGTPRILEVGTPPSATFELLSQGKEFFEKVCFVCHGKAGKGNGVLAAGSLDDWKNPLYPRNLTKGWLYKGGNAVEDIYLRVTGGINGTLMPSYEKAKTDEERWAVAHYVKSLQRPQPLGRDVVIVSKKIEGDLPLELSDPVWESAQPVDVLLSGQVHVPPRNQSPTVDVVTVRSVYNESDIAFRLEWDDRSENRIHQESERSLRMEEPMFEESYPVLYPPSVRLKNLRDSAALQFSVKTPEGSVKPHLFLGDSAKPVNLWQWKADGDAVTELNAKGYKKPAAVQPDESQATVGTSEFVDGVWSIMMTRSLETEDVRHDTQFLPGQLIPVAVHIWDGANGETGLRRSISSWSFVVLETNVPTSVYGTTAVVVLLAGGVQFWLVKRVQRQTHRKES